MVSSPNDFSRGRVVRPESACFSETAAWSGIGPGWQPVFGSFLNTGFSVEWHDFIAPTNLNWGASFHPGSLELCFNLEGEGSVGHRENLIEFVDNSAGFYARHREPLSATRAVGKKHQFLTLEFSRRFLQDHFQEVAAALHPVVRGVLEGSAPASSAGDSCRMTTSHQQIIHSLRHPPVAVPAYRLWYQCKVLEVAAGLFFADPCDENLFCTRQSRLAGERVEQVFFLLKQNLAEPLSLEELGKKIGCSPFYLSRIFSKHTGETITQALRRLRLERAAELLRSGEFNVTEAAMEVGYSSLSHFSQAFHEAFGCCPGLYPISGFRNRVQTAKSTQDDE